MSGSREEKWGNANVVRVLSPANYLLNMHLPRLQLFELEDLSWYPSSIRNLATDYLEFLETSLGLHVPVQPILSEALKRCRTNQLLDLCSGSGGPITGLRNALAEDGIDAHFTLSDKYPNTAAFERLAARHARGISYVRRPVDATDVPDSLPGFRTMFNAFHHFAPEQARTILRSAVEARQPIGVFEISERTLRTLLPLLFTPLYVALATPFMRPFRWTRLLWTYLFPLVPLTCWWDGIVSQFRAYTVSELESLASDLNATDYDWQAGRVRMGSVPGYMTYLVGVPRQ